MRKKVIIVLCFTLLTATVPVQAHVLTTNGTVGAVLHIEPQDDPIVGSESTFVFDLKDTQGKFHVKDCDCTFTVLENDTTLVQEKVLNEQENAGDTIVTRFAFPKRGVYKIQLSGTPFLESAPFSPFSLSYDIRVERTVVAAQDSSTQSPIPWALITGVIIIIGIIIASYARSRRNGAT